MRGIGLGFGACAALIVAAQGAHAQSAPLDLGPIQIPGTEPNYLDLGFGGYSVTNHYEKTETVAGRAEFRFGDKFLYIGPVVGAMMEGHYGGDIFGGFYADVKLGPIVLRPLAAVSAFIEGDRGDKNLGGTFQFREEFTAAYQFHNMSQLGVMVAHISSAGINSLNPGENELMLTYSLPIWF